MSGVNTIRLETRREEPVDPYVKELTCLIPLLNVIVDFSLMYLTFTDNVKWVYDFSKRTQKLYNKSHHN